MTTNTVIIVTDSAWVDLHSAAGASPGDPLIVEDRGAIENRLTLINSELAPVGVADVVGGIRTRVTNERFNSTPSALESTWARRTQNAGNVSIQS